MITEEAFAKLIKSIEDNSCGATLDLSNKQINDVQAKSLSQSGQGQIFKIKQAIIFSI